MKGEKQREEDGRHGEDRDDAKRGKEAEDAGEEIFARDDSGKVCLHVFLRGWRVYRRRRRM